MEKKKYIKPEIEVEFFESEMLMLSLSGDEVNTETEQLSNSYRPGRRGEWGNLWAPGEE